MFPKHLGEKSTQPRPQCFFHLVNAVKILLDVTVRFVSVGSSQAWTDHQSGLYHPFNTYWVFKRSFGMTVLSFVWYEYLSMQTVESFSWIPLMKETGYFHL